eukprot:TRINITY_DN1447_c0_g1_i3.p2 TRINITY_DN1447_c0_g1~~TRINITY_DN1447_c0_g1_i3.p2  ORF type:complete len:231 (-),score=29.47 TRINITY_DN1447_c0_g1_i3:1107-1799(-)
MQPTYASPPTSPVTVTKDQICTLPIIVAQGPHANSDHRACHRVLARYWDGQGTHRCASREGGQARGFVVGSIETLPQVFHETKDRFLELSACTGGDVLALLVSQAAAAIPLHVALASCTLDAQLQPAPPPAAAAAAATATSPPPTPPTPDSGKLLLLIAFLPLHLENETPSSNWWIVCSLFKGCTLHSSLCLQPWNEPAQVTREFRSFIRKNSGLLRSFMGCVGMNMMTM